jgi:hypothetical protein
MKKVFSLNTIKERKKNLDIILPNILKQSDVLYVNLIGYDDMPDILENDKIIINKFKKGGSEYRFYNYNDCDDDSYFFTIDDDIVYPEDYSDVLIENMKLYDNKAVCCVHFSIIKMDNGSNLYRRCRIVHNFKNQLSKNTKAMIPGVGTSCFYKKNVIINFSDFKVPNMSDPYIANFLKKQNIDVYAIKREKLWMKSLPDYGKTIFGNNPIEEIDKVLKDAFLK